MAGCVACGLLLQIMPLPAPAQPVLVPKEYEELSQMEEMADEARHLYWLGRYAEAARALDPLCEQTHASVVLYLAERGMCHLAAGDPAKARADFTQAAQMAEFFYDIKSEKQALSKYGKEAEKFYRGDPYERATGYLILALLFMDDGDYDNALAACKSGLLSDSDTTENRYESDYTLLHLAQAKCHLLRGESDEAQKCFQAARQSYSHTQPNVRDLVSDRHTQTEWLQMSKKERKKAGCEDSEATLKQRIQELDQAIQKEVGHLDIEAGLRNSGQGDYNTLVILPQGKVPVKRRVGQDAELIVFDVSQGQSEVVQIQIDDAAAALTPLENLADIGYQATTRGGRRMDSILRGQVNFKRTTVAIGRGITEAGVQAGGLAGLTLALIGAAVQGAGGAVTAEADTRCWKTLPAEFQIYSLKLPPGEHKVTFDQYLYFEKRNHLEKSFRLQGENDLAVVFGPPSLMEGYSAQAIEPRSRKRKRPEESTPSDAPTILVPPPLGFQMVERFPSPDPIKYPRNLAPDPDRMARLILDGLQKCEWRGVGVDHDEILVNRQEIASQARWALQVERGTFNLTFDNKQETYEATFRFSLIDVPTGRVAVQKELGGRYVSDSLKTSECTTALYEAFSQALSVFLAEPELRRAVSPG